MQAESASNTPNKKQEITLHDLMKGFLDDYERCRPDALKREPSEMIKILKERKEIEDSLLQKTSAISFIGRSYEQSGGGLRQEHSPSVRREMGELFTAKLFNLYNILGAMVDVVRSKIAEKGMDYLMDGHVRVNPVFVDDMRRMFDFLKWAGMDYKHFVLKPHSRRFAEIVDRDSGEQSAEQVEWYSRYLEDNPQDPDELFSDDNAMHEWEEYANLRIYDLNEDGAPSDVIAEENLKFAAFTLSHLSETLSPRGSMLSSEGRGESYFDLLKDEPLEQLDFLLNLMVRFTRTVQNMRNQQEQLLKGEESEEELGAELPDVGLSAG